jgi:hypothetical protein
MIDKIIYRFLGLLDNIIEKIHNILTDKKKKK